MIRWSLLTTNISMEEIIIGIESNLGKINHTDLIQNNYIPIIDKRSYLKKV